MSLREQLIGSWELVEYLAYATDDHSNIFHPMGRDACGIIMYNPDGYMSAQLGTSTSKKEWSDMKDYLAYTGRFFLDEKGDELGPLLVHEIRHTNEPRLGSSQRRLVEIKDEKDGRYLYLSVSAPMMMDGMARVVSLKWKRMEVNQEARMPGGGNVDHWKD